jgi:hypothetical protein
MTLSRCPRAFEKCEHASEGMPMQSSATRTVDGELARRTILSRRLSLAGAMSEPGRKRDDRFR